MKFYNLHLIFQITTYCLKSFVDNIVYHSKDDAINRIRTIIKNKCEKHQYKVSYDNLDRHMHSEMDIVISRNNGEVYKIYTLKQIKIN